MSDVDRLDVLAHWDHWLCENCDSVDGPISGTRCDVCASEGEQGEVVELVRASTTRGAVEALHRAHAALDRGHRHTAKTWEDRERFGPPPTGGR